jgi:hypothetical protein
MEGHRPKGGAEGGDPHLSRAWQERKFVISTPRDGHAGQAQRAAEQGELELRSLEIKGGASETVLTLPHPPGTATLRVLGGASELTIHRPEGIAARILVRDGTSNLAFDEQHFEAIGGETRWQSPDYDGAADRYDMEVSGGANGLTVDTK